MKRSFVIAAVIALFCSILFCLWTIFGARDTIESHRRAWVIAQKRIYRRNFGGPTSFTLLLDDALQWIRTPADDDQRMRQHEAALMRLGYLAKHDFLVTNQVLIMPQFGSNFVSTLRNRFGTNGESIWMLSFSTNRDGVHAKLPVRDIPEWDRIFRECATRWASNASTLALTNAPQP